MAGIYHFQGEGGKVNVGESLPRVVTWNSGGSPVNLTGYGAELVVYGGPMPGAALLATLTAAGGGLTLGGAAGTVTINFGQLPAAMPPGTDYHYTLTLTSGAGVSKRLLEGALDYVAKGGV